MKLQINLDKNIFKGSKPGFRLAWMTSSYGVIFGQVLFDDFETAYCKAQDIACNSECIILHFDGKGNISVVT